MVAVTATATRELRAAGGDTRGRCRLSQSALWELPRMLRAMPRLRPSRSGRQEVTQERLVYKLCPEARRSMGHVLVCFTFC